MFDQRGEGRRAVLDAIRRGGHVARADVASCTGISRPTVTTITAELLQAGLIEEVPKVDGAADDRARGRPRIDLKLRGAAHLVAGVKIGTRVISIVLMDFEGRLTGEHETPLSATELAPDALLAALDVALSAAVNMAGYQRNDLSAIGIGLAGFVDPSEGFVHWSPSLTTRNLPFGDMLNQRLGVPVFLDNDVNLVAVAEQYFGLAQGVSNFLVVTIESGVGMAIVLGDEIYRGNRGCAAEFGHTKVQLDGALCRCGQRGCLEAYVADYALLREAAVLGSLNEDAPPEQRIQTILQAARNGDPMASSIVSRAGRMFAMGLANLVNVFDPQLIILSGDRMQFEHLYAEEVLDSIKSSIVRVDAKPPEVVIHRWGNLMWAKGAAAYALNGVSDLALAGIADNAA